MDHIVIYIHRLMIFTTFGLPMLCGAVGEFAVNIAYGKPATQSSTYIGREDYHATPGFPYNASLAVDGNSSTSFTNDRCSHTGLNSNSAWWEVDLLDLYNVLNITIYQRSDGNIDWLRGFVTMGKLSNNSFIIIDNTAVYKTGIITIPVSKSLKFKGIRIELNKEINEHAAICLCEVEVLAEINVAERKLAKQSSIYNETSPKVTYFNASLAVDGNTDTDFSKKSCSCTKPGDRSPWWIVDLQALYFIIGIRIYQRMDSEIERLKGFTLVGVHADGSYEKIQTPQPYQSGEIVIRLARSRMLKEIRVHLNQTTLTEGPIITLCEVQVFAGIMCPSPPTFPKRGLYEFIPGKEGEWSYNFSLIIHCIEGYIINGPSSLMCADINHWNGTFGFCSAKRCKNPVSQVEHGMLSFQSGTEGNGTYNTVVSLNCMQGYKRDTHGELRCADDEQWQGRLGLCLAKRCNQSVSQVTHGILSFQSGTEGNGTYNTVVSLNCMQGYKRDTHGDLRCSDDEQWQGILGLCLAKRCNQSVPQVENGVLTFQNGFEGIGTYNTVISLNCIQGYKRDTHGELRCADDEQWQGKLGLCLVKRCDKQPPQVAHGVLIFKDGLEGNGTYNTTVSLNCTEGYKRDIIGQLRCADDEQWHGQIGLCLDVDECIYGDNVCRNNGHCINTQGSFSCRCYEGFTGNKCETVIPCHIPDMDSKKGIYELHPDRVGNISHTSYLTIKCKEGYRLIGSDIIRCTRTGEWDTSIGQCTVIQCSGSFILPNNSMHLYEEGIEGNLTYNSTISIRCEEGYKLSGTDLIRCNEFGVWDRLLGTCHVIDCGWPENVPRDVPLLVMSGIAGGFSYNATACIQNNEGVKKFGDIYESLRCSSEGYWRGRLGKCFDTTKKEAYNDDDEKKVILPVAVFVPICLILIATNIVTLFKLRRYECYRGQPSEQMQTGMTIADQFGSSQNEITERQQRRLIYTNGDIELQRKSGSEETHSQGTGPYDELQKEHRENSEYDELKFKIDLTSNKGTMYENTDEFAHI